MTSVEKVAGAPLFTERVALHTPSLDELADAIQLVLAPAFEQVEVKVVDCPDLSKDWDLPSPGLTGSPRLLDIGGVPNLCDPAYNNVSFSIADLATSAELPNGVFYGAGAGDAGYLGQNSELMPADDLKANSRMTQVALIPTQGGDEHKQEHPAFVLKDYPWDRIGFLCNLYGHEGQQGPVIQVRAKKRIGEKNFITQLREGLKEKYADKLVGLGGVFKLQEGRFKAHIMPNFLGRYMEDGPNDSGKWLKFYEFGSGATFLTTFVSGNPPADMHVRVEHTHFYNKKTGEGGHYHFDTTPNEAEYLAYLHPAEWLYRIEDAFDRSKTNSKQAAKL